MGHGQWLMGERPHPWCSVQGADAEQTPPTGAQGIEKYLASGQMRGIGPAMAKRIVATFGEATFDIIEATSPSSQ